MYDPKAVFTKDGYFKYVAHIQNIKEGIAYINNHVDDLHVGAKDSTQLDTWYDLVKNFESLEDVLLSGDGETETD